MDDPAHPAAQAEALKAFAARYAPDRIRGALLSWPRPGQRRSYVTSADGLSDKLAITR